MKLICPSCANKVDIGSDSRYEIYQCNCGRQFRGIHASVASLDFALHNTKNILTSAFTMGLWTSKMNEYMSEDRTPCIHCNWGIRVGSGVCGSGVPSRCERCCGDLPVIDAYEEIKLIEEAEAKQKEWLAKKEAAQIEYERLIKEQKEEEERESRERKERNERTKIERIIKEEKERLELEELADPEMAIFRNLSPKERTALFEFKLLNSLTLKELKALVLKCSKYYTEEEQAEYTKRGWILKLNKKASD